MAQLSIYIEPELYQKLQERALHEDVSISKWVVKRLKSELESTYPENFVALAGSLKDSDFSIESDYPQVTDIPREIL